jgi:uncharacterized protein (DUF1015 family)
VAVLKPFAAVRPAPGLAPSVAAPPYDVVDVHEARDLASENPDSFLHVSRPEIDLPDTVDPHSPEVYAQGRAALDDFLARGVLVPDEEARYLVYRQRLGRTLQTGVVAVASVADYDDGTIATHEHTRRDKEDDRVAHIDALAAHDEPVFLMYREDTSAASVVARVVAETLMEDPVEDFTTPDGVSHRLWVVEPGDPASTLESAFGAIGRLYVADGHHRSAAASRVAALRDGAGESGLFLAVTFPADELNVLAYNRVVADLAGHHPEALLAALAETYAVVPEGSAVAPATPHTIGVYLAGQWYHGHLRPDLVDESDPIARLDISILQDRVLAPVLGIADPRTDQRISFVGGGRGIAELERLVDSERFAVAFSMCPTTTHDVMDVADQGKVMPPKSTWFEPKLASGLFLHRM